MSGKESKGAGFAPTNLAVNFRRPDRFKNEMEAADATSSGTKARSSSSEVTVTTQRTVVVGELPRERSIQAGEEGTAAASEMVADAQKATDDLHLTKFKQHFQRK